VHVIGTTGFSEVDLGRIADAAARHRIVRAGNMSLGVNLLVQLTRQVAAALDADFDIEVVEAHHPQGRCALRHRADAGRGGGRGRGVALGEMSPTAGATASPAHASGAYRVLGHPRRRHRG
jgi:4-hydroxy-tetrahydrodipicolinate reductase